MSQLSGQLKKKKRKFMVVNTCIVAPLAGMWGGFQLLMWAPNGDDAMLMWHCAAMHDAKSMWRRLGYGAVINYLRWGSRMRKRATLKLKLSTEF